MISRRGAACAVALLSPSLAVSWWPTPAFAQSTIERRIADEPTAGLTLPATPLAGEHDARAVTVNPAGLRFLGGPILMVAADVVDPGAATRNGAGVAAYLGAGLGGGLIPRLGFGLGVEVLRAPEGLFPDPGSPTRLTYAQAFGLGASAALGVSWHHFFDDGATGGLDTFDAGLSWRLGNRLAVGAVVRDLGAPEVSGEEVPRRYELELTVRPLATDRLDLGLGGRIDERRGDIDGWLRASLRIARGVYLHAAAESRAVRHIEIEGDVRRDLEEREVGLTVGLEVSFGAIGIAGYGNGRIDADGAGQAVGATVVARASVEEVPAVQGRPGRIERIDLTGSLSAREHAELVLRLRALERDDALKAMVVALDGVDAGWASLEEIRDGLLRLRRAGKKVFAYMVAGTGRDYWVATAADRIYVDPAGGVRLAGFSGTTLYYKGAFDKLGVQAQFEKIAEYKSAPEAYTETGPSEPALRMRNELYDSLWDELVGGIARGRRLDRATVIELIDRGPFTSGDLASDQQLVDAVADPERVAQLIMHELGGGYPIGRAPAERPDRWRPPGIAVIFVDGDIIDGKSVTVPLLGRRLAGGETIAAAIAAARDAPEVSAIVLRIDSPGGSALASELMAREVFKTRGVKPILCSLGDVAASGGYFLAAGCDVIFADRTSITGSIGIFYGKFDMSGLLDKLGIAAETFRRGRRADMESFFRPYTEEERAHVRKSIRYFYQRFVAAVAAGRGMSKEKVDEIGRGHVWSGVQGKTIGLVDRFGGLADAVDFARAKIGLPADAPVRIITLPDDSAGILGWILGGIAAEPPGVGAALRDLPGAAALLDAIPASVWMAPESPQARLPFAIQWH